MDPEVADAELADEAILSLESVLETAPIVELNLTAIQAAIEIGTVEPDVGLGSGSLVLLDEIAAQASDLGIDVPTPIENADDAAELVAALDEAAASETPPEGVADLAAAATAAVTEGSDPDGDGLSTAAEGVVTNQMTEANLATMPGDPPLQTITLDPANPASVGGEPDLETAAAFVGSLESLHTQLQVATDNQNNLLDQEQGGVDYLLEAEESRTWEIDFEGVAESMGLSVEEAQRAVGLFNSNCARCHTAGFSAGVPYTQEAGSGGFGPALWDGRPVVQFGDATPEPIDDLLVQFLIRGSEAQTPYGLNGFGSGRMPSFGALLSQEDIELLAAYLRGGNMDGKAQP